MTRAHTWSPKFAMVALTVLAAGCFDEPPDTSNLVFGDDYAAGVGYQAFARSKLDAARRDPQEHYAGIASLGFRVPTIVAGPYAKRGVNSTVLEHCSVLAHLERQFGLVPLNARTAASNDLSSTIDTDRMAIGPDAPIALPAVEIDESQLGADCAMISEILDDHPMHQLADRFPDRFAKYDHRHLWKDQLYLIGDYLEQHNAGRIRRGQ